MNMFKPVPATSVKEYLDMLPKERRVLIEYLHTFIKNTVPKLEPHFAYNMLGYGNFKYKNYKKETIDWPIIGLANQKNYMSIYICAVDKDGYIAEKYKQSLGKVHVGKSCIRFKKIEDLNLETLSNVIKLAAEFPGLILNQDR